MIRLLEILQYALQVGRDRLTVGVSEILAGERRGGLLDAILFILMRYLPRVRSRGSSLR